MKQILFCLLLTMSSSHADTFTVAAYGWEPFIDSKREDGGISIALVRKIMKSQGHDIKLTSMPWARSLVMLEKGKIDILPAVWFTQERSETMLYSDSYAANRLVFIKLKDSDYEYNGLPSLYDKTVGVIRDYGYDEAFLNDNNIQRTIADSLNSNIKKLITGRIDLTLDDEIVSKTTIDPMLRKRVEFTQNALNENPLFIACSKKDSRCPIIIESFNRGLATMQTDGSLSQVLAELGL
ncbi:MAG: substrate-binding periplasmic protein [Cellvibrionaceae bacterium]